MLTREKGTEIVTGSMKADVRAHGMAKFVCKYQIEIVLLKALVSEIGLVSNRIGIHAARIISNYPVIEVRLQLVSILGA
jgi:hypothetical protein